VLRHIRALWQAGAGLRGLPPACVSAKWPLAFDERVRIVQ
jgi:hypothetical protein